MVSRAKCKTMFESLFKFLRMSRIAPTRLAPILSYGLDIPITQFSPAAHSYFKFNYVSDKAGLSMKFFEKPVYIHAHGIVRKTKDQYGKVTFSVLDHESAFVRQVEKTVLDTLDNIVNLAEPALQVLTSPAKSMTYENLLKLKVNKTVGQDESGRIVEFDEHEAILARDTKVLMTLEVHGAYHGVNGKGVIARIHCYRVVSSF